MSEEEIRRLYCDLLGAWNARNAARIAECFAPHGAVVSLDGSQINGRAEIERAFGEIFANRPTGTCVSIVREVRELAPGVALLRAVAGMTKPSETVLETALNAVQSIIAVRVADWNWNIELFQSTPAAFEGRRDANRALAEELSAKLNADITDDMRR